MLYIGILPRYNEAFDIRLLRFNPTFSFFRLVFTSRIPSTFFNNLTIRNEV